MIKQCICFIVALGLLTTFLQAQHSESPPPRATRCGQGAAYSTHDATVLSMMGWGMGLGLGIALLCGLLEQSTVHSHTASEGTVH